MTMGMMMMGMMMGMLMMMMGMMMGMMMMGIIMGMMSRPDDGHGGLLIRYEPLPQALLVVIRPEGDVLKLFFLDNFFSFLLSLIHQPGWSNPPATSSSSSAKAPAHFKL